MPQAYPYSIWSKEEWNRLTDIEKTYMMKAPGHIYIHNGLHYVCEKCAFSPRGDETYWNFFPKCDTTDIVITYLDLFEIGDHPDFY